MTSHCRHDKPEAGIDHRHRDYGQRTVEAALTFIGDHDWSGLVRSKNRHFLGNIIGGRSSEAGSAHQYERLRGEVNVFLVFGDVASDRLVAELRELDAHFVRRNLVDAISHERPITPGGRELAGSLANEIASGDHLFQSGRNLAESFKQ